MLLDSIWLNNTPNETEDNQSESDAHNDVARSSVTHSWIGDLRVISAPPARATVL
jgi:hypothetical protein